MICVSESNVSTAWVAAAAALDQSKREAFHTVVRIADPVAEIPAIREAMDRILSSRQKQSVETVANTIFPAALTRICQDHEQLVRRYVDVVYPRLKTFPKNNKGVYFHRLIQYPTQAGPFDQIGAVIDRIGIERATPGPIRARYEATIDAPGDVAVSTPVYVPGTDNSPRSFPCLSHCSFQLDTAHGRVHLLANYRSQFLVERGYGNYLGLGRLLAYVAAQTGLQTGQLTVVAGLAHLESPITPVRDLVVRFAGELTR